MLLAIILAVLAVVGKCLLLFLYVYSRWLVWFLWWLRNKFGDVYGVLDEFDFYVIYLCVAAIPATYVYRHGVATVLSKIISLFSVRYNTGRLRARFQRFEWTVPEMNMPVNHSHPQAAKHRDGISRRLTEFIRSVDFYDRYDVSMSRREQRARVHGNRLYYNVKDLITPYQYDPLMSNHIVTFCDVDYYVSPGDFPSIVSGLPFMVYTFNPDTLAGKTSNGHFWHADEHAVCTMVQGGEIYYHPLFDYSRTTVVMPYFFSFVVYDVDRVSVGDHREVVMFTPRVRVFDPFGIVRRIYGISNHFMRQVTVKRDGDWLHKIHVGKKQVRSIQKVGQTISCEMEETSFLACLGSYCAAKHNNISDVEKYLLLVDRDTKKAALHAPILFHAMAEIGEKSVFSIGLPAPSYQCVDVDLDGDGQVKPPRDGGGGELPPGDKGNGKGVSIGTMIAPIHDNKSKATNVAVGPSIVAFGGPSPVESLTNDVVTVKKRVVEPHNVKVPPPIYEQYAKEFVDLVVRDRMVGRGVPWSHDQVIEAQARPLQRIRSELMRWWLSGKTVVKCFQKKETYGKVSAPRNISTVPPHHTVGLSRFTYAFKYAVLHRMSWYMPCRTPRGTVEAVRKYVSTRDVINSSDYSSFDGTNSRWLRTNVERAAYLRFFGKEYEREIIKYFDDEFNAVAITKNGVKYRPDGSRLSGSPLTTDGNTMLNSFASYCGYRLAGKAPIEAFKLIGPKYGDDSIEGVECKLDEVCAAIGFVIKNDFRERGSEVPFLGRYFINPWISDRTIQDPLRTIIKIHQAFPDGKTTPRQALANRVHGYMVSDSETPIIGNYCKAVQRIDANLEYVAGIDKELDMRVENGSWPQCDELEADTVKLVAKSCGLLAGDVFRICEIIDAAKTLDDIPVMINNSLKITIPAVVDGKLVMPNT